MRTKKKKKKSQYTQQSTHTNTWTHHSTCCATNAVRIQHELWCLRIVFRVHRWVCLLTIEHIMHISHTSRWMTLSSKIEWAFFSVYYCHFCRFHFDSDSDLPPFFFLHCFLSFATFIANTSRKLNLQWNYTIACLFAFLQMYLLPFELGCM